MEPLQIALNVLTLVLSSILAYYLARRYGDVAGTEAAIEYEKKKTAKARIVAFKALLNEIARIRSLACQNSRLNDDIRIKVPSVLKMPVMAFETAFLSGESHLLDERSEGSTELLSCVTTYLTEAYTINRHVDVYLRLLGGLPRSSGTGYGAGARANALREIMAKSHELTEVLDRLEKHLKHRLEVEVRGQWKRQPGDRNFNRVLERYYDSKKDSRQTSRRRRPY